MVQISERAKSITGRIALIGVHAALICICAPLSIYLGAVPVSLATFAVMLSGFIAGPAAGVQATGIYLLLGIAGLPVFAGARAGIAVLAGPTGGYLAGYLLLAAICGLYVYFEKKVNSDWSKAAILIALGAAGTAVLYLTGTAWYCIVTGSGIGAAITVCVLPFLPGDALKIAACAVLTLSLRRRLKL